MPALPVPQASGGKAHTGTGRPFTDAPPAPSVGVPQHEVSGIDELKTLLVQQLQSDHTMLATTVNKTFNWVEKDGVLFISVHTPFDVRQLQQGKSVLMQKIAQIYGKGLTIEIGLTQEAMKAPLPARVEMVLHALKGSVVDIQKKRVSEDPEEDG